MPGRLTLPSWPHFKPCAIKAPCASWLASPRALDADGGRLSALRLINAEAAEQALPCDAIVACLGLAPKLGPIADWGLQLEHKLLVVDPARFETSEPASLPWAT